MTFKHYATNIYYIMKMMFLRATTFSSWFSNGWHCINPIYFSIVTDVWFGVCYTVYININWILNMMINIYIRVLIHFILCVSSICHICKMMFIRCYVCNMYISFSWYEDKNGRIWYVCLHVTIAYFKTFISRSGIWWQSHTWYEWITFPHKWHL